MTQADAITVAALALATFAVVSTNFAAPAAVLQVHPIEIISQE